MDCDGVKDGFDIPLTRAITRELNIPVIASGGAGKLEHFAEAVVEADADAVLAASVFHFGEYTVRQVKEAMASAGVPVRFPVADESADARALGGLEGARSTADTHQEHMRDLPGRMRWRNARCGGR